MAEMIPRPGHPSPRRHNSSTAFHSSAPLEPHSGASIPDMDRKGPAERKFGMEASSGISKVRTIVIDLLAIFFVMLCVAVGAAVEARAEPREQLAPMRASEAAQGTLLFRGKAETETCPAPLLHTDVEIRVSGVVARTRVTQSFRNPFDEWLEGVYVFPLPENSAVDRL